MEAARDRGNYILQQSRYARNFRFMTPGPSKLWKGAKGNGVSCGHVGGDSVPVTSSLPLLPFCGFFDAPPDDGHIIRMARGSRASASAVVAYFFIGFSDTTPLHRVTVTVSMAALSV